MARKATGPVTWSRPLIHPGSVSNPLSFPEVIGCFCHAMYAASRRGVNARSKRLLSCCAGYEGHEGGEVTAGWAVDVIEV